MLTSLALLLMGVATPDAQEKPPARIPRGFVLRLDAGGFLGSGWSTQTYRDQLAQLQAQGSKFWAEGVDVDSELLVRTLPIAGPLLTLEYGGSLARAEAAQLVLVSVFQSVGLALLSWQVYLRHEPPEPPAALELSISPLVAGRLGLSLTLVF